MEASQAGSTQRRLQRLHVPADTPTASTTTLRPPIELRERHQTALTDTTPSGPPSGHHHSRRTIRHQH